MQDLIPLHNPEPPVLFAAGGTREICALIEREARALVPDITTQPGRNAIASMAAKIARSKTYLDNLGKLYVDELKELPKQVDAERRAMRNRLDELKEEIRAPLTEWEMAIEARQKRIREMLDGVALQANDLDGLSIDELTVRLECVENVELGDEWEEYIQEARATKARAAAILKHAIIAAREHARFLAEREAANQAQIAREQAHREQQIRIEAAAAARAATLAEVAQRQPITQVPAGPAPLREDRALIHRAILADLEDHGIPTETAKRLIVAIARGEIFHLAITY
ncbi:MAG: hypothetical protein KAX46_01360 [Chromatiaceae bacterium]|nr:hypothetical protein [Chromatiaceae bacterium]